MKKVVIAILIFAAGVAISWASTVGIIKLITVCFGWEFPLLWATGAWLLLWLLNGFLSRRGEIMIEHRGD